MTRALTAKGAATRQRIVAGTADLVRARGADQVGLDDIRAATATSKSQLFHYFPDGRAELLRAVAAHEAGEVLSDQQPFLDGLGPAGSWQAWRDAVVAKYQEQGVHCPLSALTTQLGPADPGIRVIVADLLDTWHTRIADGVRRAQAAGLADPSLEADKVASSILASIQGGVVMMQATGNIEFLKVPLDAALAVIEPPAGA
ncbi:TetR/AcrR family transcriptional regulator [Planotetraspora phitsanulokensis]|uniref:TetR family transcriptional regulator n=1 Tax=Planotetraspora phitsanulokensis TaxID=575192 RepID=A0A8J3UBB3_9ACTN|nr:TetR/AcrR family transcriptional regulator [Planotetraspora phitsanulokensis]GII42253.1 TetR family transcriptional regulator [Planotetraspora phitsanulokensis]